MSDNVQRWLSILLGAAVVVLMGWITLNQSERRPRPEVDAGLAAATAVDAGAEPASTTPQAKNNEKPDLDAGLSLFFLDAGTMMPNGAPRAVKLGVVLVQYQGAEGASSNVRSKREALAVAQKLAEQAKTDWKGAVKSGDSGSAEDIGRIPRGVLDAATEVAVFSLAAGDVSGVLDTPRGYWIVKRAE